MRRESILDEYARELAVYFAPQGASNCAEKVVRSSLYTISVAESHVVSPTVRRVDEFPPERNSCIEASATSQVADNGKIAEIENHFPKHSGCHRFAPI